MALPLRLGSASSAPRIAALAGFAFAVASAIVAGSGCAELRRADLGTAPDAGSPSDPDGEAGSIGDRLHLDPPSEELPKVTYRAVKAVAPDRVFIVGDEVILEFVGTKWKFTPVGGVELHGVWADAEDAWAVGFKRNTNTGVIMHREKTTWIEFATVPHGLRSIYGDGTFRMATGNDGAVYYGNIPV